MNDSWFRMFDSCTLAIVQCKWCVVIYVLKCWWEEAGIRHERSSHDVWSTWLFTTICLSNSRFCFPHVYQTSHCSNQRCPWPTDCPYLATSSVSCNGKVNTRYNDQFFQNKHFATSAVQLHHIAHYIWKPKSSSESSDDLCWGSKSQSIGIDMQLTMWTVVLRREHRETLIYAIMSKIDGQMIMRIRKLLLEESWFNTLTIWVCKTRLTWEELNRNDQEAETLESDLTACRMQSPTMWVILHLLTMTRKANTSNKIKNIQGLASRAKIMNPAGWGEYSVDWYCATWRVIGRSRWGFSIWLNMDVSTHSGLCLGQRWDTAWLNCWFLRLWCSTQIYLQPHHHQPPLMYLYSIFILSPYTPQRGKLLPDPQLVTWGCVHRNLKNPKVRFLPRWREGQICDSCIIQILMIQEAIPSEHHDPGELTNSNWILMMTWWLLLLRRRNRLPSMTYLQRISGEIHVFTCCVRCQLGQNFGDQIMTGGK